MQHNSSICIKTTLNSIFQFRVTTSLLNKVVITETALLIHLIVQLNQIIESFSGDEKMYLHLKLKYLLIQL